MTDANAAWSPGSRRETGWLVFAATLLIMSGSFKLLDSFWAFKYDDDVSEQLQTIVFERDLTAWGWIMLIWGVLLALAGVGLLGGQGWARWFAIVVVSLNFIAQLGFLGNTQNTLWSLTGIALSIIVLYALTARWSESQAERPFE